MKKNVIIITFDQMRADFGFSTGLDLNLKNISNLKKYGGINFKNCYTSCPQCVPARISWITGKHASRWGIQKNEDVNLWSDAPSFMRKLRDGGWETTLIGKTHWTSHRHPKDLRTEKEFNKKLGIDHITEVAGPRALRHIRCELTDLWEEKYLRENYITDLTNRYSKNILDTKPWSVSPTPLPNELYPDIWIGNQAEKIISKLPIEIPWVLWISFVGPHEPFDTPKDWSQYNVKNDICENKPPQHWTETLDKNSNQYKQHARWKGKMSKKEIADLREDYAKRCILLDEQVGKIIQEAIKRKDNERTSVIVTSDHGEMLGDHGMLYKGNLLQEAIRVPFIYLDSLKSLELKESAKNIERPVLSTDILNRIIKKTIKQKINKSKLTKDKSYVCVEYDEDMAIITDKLKCVYDSSGKLQWCTKMNKDKIETDDNVYTNDLQDIEGSDEWDKIERIKNKEIKKRQKDNWVIRNLRNTKKKSDHDEA